MWSAPMSGPSSLRFDRSPSRAGTSHGKEVGFRRRVSTGNSVDVVGDAGPFTLEPKSRLETQAQQLALAENRFNDRRAIGVLSQKQSRVVVEHRDAVKHAIARGDPGRLADRKL